MKENLFKNKKGITLIALVVTIVILLILAAVTISFVLGEGGIIDRAKNVQNVVNTAKLNDEESLEELNNRVDELVTGSVSGTRDGLTEEQVDAKINTAINIYRAGHISVPAINSKTMYSYNVVFSEELKDANYAIIISRNNGAKEWANVEFSYASKTKSGFTFYAWNEASVTSDALTADWVAIPFK